MTTRPKYWLHISSTNQATSQVNTAVSRQTARNFGLDPSLDNCHSCDPVDPGHWVATLPVRCGASGDISPRSESGSLLSVTPNLVEGRGSSRPGYADQSRAAD